MALTEDGQRLYTQAAEAIECLESVTGRGPSTVMSRRVRLGTPHEFFVERMLPRLTPEDRTHYVVRFGLSGQLLDGLAAGELDMVVTTQQGTRADIAYRPLFRECFWLVALLGAAPPPESGLPSLERAFRGQPWISYGPELPIIRRFWRQVFDRRLDATSRLIIPDLRAIRAAVAGGLGVSALPNYLCQRWVEDGRLACILEPVPPVTNDIWPAYRRSERHGGHLQTFLSILDATGNATSEERPREDVPAQP